MKTLKFAIVFASLLSLVLVGCNVFKTTAKVPDPAQVAQISTVAQNVVGIGVQSVLAKNPDLKAQLIAIAELIEQATNQPDAPSPTNLISLVGSAVGAIGGPYGYVVQIALQGGLMFYQNFYAANVNSALDKQPAFKQVLLAMAKGIRDGTGAPAANPVQLDLVLKPAR
jgi:hypothetical protein